MTRIAVIGTSHVAMMKTGWDQIAAAWPSIEVTFFASPGRAARAKRLDGMIYGYHSVDPDPSEIIVGNDGQRTLDLSGFDHVLKVGDATGEVLLADIVAAFSVDGLGPAGRSHQMSHTAFEDMCRRLAERRSPPPPWHHWEGTRLWQVPHPYPDTRVLDDTRPRFAPWATLCPPGDPHQAHRALYRETYRDMLDDRGIGLVDQPAETLSPEGLSLPAFSTGSLNIADDSPLAEADFLHMNGRYGALIWQDVLEQIKPAPAAAPKVA